MAAKLTYLYDLTTTISSNLTVDQIVSTMIFGSSGIAGVYNPEHVYTEGDIVSYIDDYGTIHVLKCVNSGATGDPIDPTDWEEYSILEHIRTISDNLILLAQYKPTEEGNRVWIQFRGGGEGIPEDNYGLIIRSNFIISPDEPENFSTDLVWGKVTTA